MNESALYQFERAVDALTQMAKILREEKKSDSISFSAPAVTGSHVMGGWGEDHISFYGYDTYKPFNSDVVTF